MTAGPPRGFWRVVVAMPSDCKAPPGAPTGQAPCAVPDLGQPHNQPWRPWAGRGGASWSAVSFSAVHSLALFFLRKVFHLREKFSQISFVSQSTLDSSWISPLFLNFFPCYFCHMNRKAGMWVSVCLAFWHLVSGLPEYELTSHPHRHTHTLLCCR